MFYLGNNILYPKGQGLFDTGSNSKIFIHIFTQTTSSLWGKFLFSSH